MAQGNSGRVVIDIDPDLKKDVYQVLKSQGCNMRQWFLTMVEREFALKEDSCIEAEELGNRAG